MIALLKQPSPIETVRQSQSDGARAVPARAQLLAFAMGFACFMPYPALPVGNSSAIQIGNVLTALLCVGSLAAPSHLWWRRMFVLYPLILAPLVISLVKVILSGDGDVGQSLRSTLVWSASGLALLATQLYARDCALELLTGIAVATVTHVAIGLWQLYSFSMNQMPLEWLYINPSFLSVQDNAHTIARWIRRPFGLFPEPSAMSSSLAPWVLFWIASACGVIQLRVAPNHWQQGLFNTAAVGGLGLIILSQSGHTIVTLGPALLFVAIWFARRRANGRTLLYIAGLGGVVLPLTLWFAAVSLSQRVGRSSDMVNGSWEERYTSLKIGFSIWTESGIATALFGVGSGLSSSAILKVAGLEAVWSVLLGYVYETGLVGAGIAFYIGCYLLNLWKQTRYDAAFGSITFVWIVGITLTTSYGHLLPLWITLGWLTAWPAIVAPKQSIFNAEGSKAFSESTGARKSRARRSGARPRRRPTTGI